MTAPTSSIGGWVTKAERRLAPDLARGFMLLMITMAYSAMYLPHGDVGGYGLPPGGGSIDRAVAFGATVLLENRAFPLFGILFGAGMVMLVGRQQHAGTPDTRVRRLLRRRSLWLLVFGLVHATLVFPGEILAAYGLGSLLVGWLLFRSDVAVHRAIGVLAAYYVVVVFAGSVAMAGMTGGDRLLPGFATAADWTARIVGAPFGPVMNTFFFPLLILVAIGIWFGRKGLVDHPERRLPLLRRLAVVGVSVSVIGALPLALAGADALRVGAPVVGVLSAVQVLTGVIGGVGYAAAFALLGNKLQQRPGAVSRVLAAAGQRSLSVYLFCSVGVAVLVHPDLLGIGDHVHRAGAVAIAFGVWLVAIVLARFLDAAGRPGPADALLRRLVYRR